MSKQAMITVEVWDTFWNENTASSCGIEIFESGKYKDFVKRYGEYDEG